MAKGFVYLVAVIDWASRKVLAAKIALTLETCHAVDVFKEAFNKHGSPEIVDTDQGSQFTSKEFVQAVGSVWMVVELGETMFLLNDFGKL